MPVIVDDGVRKLNSDSEVSREEGIVDLCWTAQDKEFASLLNNGSVRIWKAETDDNAQFGSYAVKHSLDSVFGEKEPSKMKLPLGLGSFNKGNTSFLAAGNHHGKIVVLNPNHDTPIRSSFSVFKEATHVERDYNVQFPLASCMAVSDNGTVAVGGKDRETVLWNLETSKQVWKAKNLAADQQTLLHPEVWPTAVQFWKDAGCGEEVLVVGSALHQIRIYDIRSERRRPQFVTNTLDHRITSICPIDEHQIVVGDAAGYLCAVDVRKLDRKVAKTKSSMQTVTHGRFVGPNGSIKSVVKHCSQPRIAVVGLDRMLRIYDTVTRKQLSCMYLKQRLRSALLATPFSQDDGEFVSGFDDEDIDQEDKVDDYVDSDDESDRGSEATDISDDHVESSNKRRRHK